MFNIEHQSVGGRRMVIGEFLGDNGGLDVPRNFVILQ